MAHGPYMDPIPRVCTLFLGAGLGIVLAKGHFWTFLDQRNSTIMHIYPQWFGEYIYGLDGIQSKIFWEKGRPVMVSLHA